MSPSTGVLHSSEEEDEEDENDWIAGIESCGTSLVGRRAFIWVFRMVARALGLKGPAVRGALRADDDFEPNVRVSAAVILSESFGRAAGFFWSGRGANDNGENVCCWWWWAGDEGNEKGEGECDSTMGEVGKWIASILKVMWLLLCMDDVMYGNATKVK